jgi:protein CpxP
MVRTAILAAILSATFGVAATAQTTTAPATGTATPAPAAGTTTDTTMEAKQGVVLASPGELKKGANSFTEAQAKSRLEGFGFTSVTGLTKDVDGVWWATASMDAKSVKVGLDYQGNIAAE